MNELLSLGLPTFSLDFHQQFPLLWRYFTHVEANYGEGKTWLIRCFAASPPKNPAWDVKRLFVWLHRSTSFAQCHLTTNWVFCCGSLTHLTIMDSFQRYLHWEISLLESQINLGLNLSSYRVALRPAVLSAARIWRFPSASGGLPTRLLPLSVGVHRPTPEEPLIWGMSKGP